MEIKILGAGCKKCNTLEQKVRELVTSENIDATIEKVTDLNEMVSYGIMMTPGLIINDEIKSIGIVPKESQLIEWLKGNSK